MAKRIAALLGLVAAVSLGAASSGDAMAERLLSETRFTADGASLWEPWAPREEIRPACVIDAAVSRTGADGSLRTECRSAAEWGGWRLLVEGVKAGQWYRFDAYYRPREVTRERRAVSPARLLDAQAGRGSRSSSIIPRTPETDGGTCGPGRRRRNGQGTYRVVPRLSPGAPSAG
jgi:hypothetical protein